MKKKTEKTYVVVFTGDVEETFIEKAETAEEAFENVCSVSFDDNPEEMLEVCNVEVHEIANTVAVLLKPKDTAKKYYTTPVK